MMNEEVLSTADDFLALRERFVSESTGAQFKTQVVGGFRQDEVKEFIIQMKEDYRTLEQRMKGEMNDLIASKLKMEQELEGTADLQKKLDKAQADLHIYVSECREKDSEIELLQKQICQMSDQRDEMKELLSEAGQEISRLMDISEGVEKENDVFEELEQKIEMLQESKLCLEKVIGEKDAEMEELRRIGEDAIRELKQEKARVLNDEITGFKDEVAGIYKKIETIAEEQLKINSELQEKLDQQEEMNNELQRQVKEEILRAEKAEADQAAYVKCICELKESLFRERAHLEAQLSQIAERRDDVDGRLMSLQKIL